MAIGVGTGIYTAREASRLTGLSVSRIKRWISGYSYRRGGDVRKSPPVIVRPSEDGPTLAFLDLIEILFVNAFLEHGISMRKIRLASAEAVDLFHTDHPFAVNRFETDGNVIFARLTAKKSRKKHIVEVVGGQSVFDRVVSPYLKQIEYRSTGDAARWWPLGKKRPVLLDPTIAFGAPVTKTAHVPTFAIGSAVAAGQTPTEVAKWYDIPLKDVRAAMTLEQQLAA
jgi:uncharacterized protein (DUF433 family)